MVGAGRAVLLGAAAELAPDVDEHAVGEAAGLEVALERAERGGGEREPVREVVAWSACVSYMPGALKETQRSGRPPAIMAASPQASGEGRWPVG